MQHVGSSGYKSNDHDGMAGLPACMVDPFQIGVDSGDLSHDRSGKSMSSILVAENGIEVQWKGGEYDDWHYPGPRLHTESGCPGDRRACGSFPYRGGDSQLRARSDPASRCPQATAADGK